MQRAGARGLAAATTLAAVLAACGNGTETSPPAPAQDASPSETASPQPVVLAEGVTTAPCPGREDDALGCIYLAVLADTSEGPFAALGASTLRGTQAFWERVNAEGGIAGRFAVDVTRFVRDTRFDPSAHAAAAVEVAPDVAAIALSFGTEPTVAALQVLDRDGPLVVPGSLWSGWAFEEGVVPSGYSYCLESVGALDWFVEERAPVEAVVSVHHGDLFGRDSQAGVQRWADANGVVFDQGQHAIVTPRTSDDVTQDDTVAAIVEVAPDVVVLAIGPLETAEIVAKSRAEGYEGRFIGSGPTWNPALLETRAADALRDTYDVVLPWQPWGADTPAHAAMQETMGDGAPSTEGFVFGWMTQYPLLEALRQAAADGDPTRDRLRGSLVGSTVTYEGGAPPRAYGEGAEPQRRVTIATPGDGGVLGSVVSAEGYLGSTAASVALDAPCVTP